jgi:hypothetical protein
MEIIASSLTVRCANCGFLAARAKKVGRWRPHAGYFEVEVEDREHPRAEFQIVPGETNAVQNAELGCFRGAADLRREVAELSVSIAPDEAAREVIQKTRSCRSWTSYRPGLDPLQLYTELRTEALEEDRREFHTRLSKWEQEQSEREQRQGHQLTRAAIWLAVILGLAQIVASILSMSNDSIGSQLLKALLRVSANIDN